MAQSNPSQLTLLVYVMSPIHIISAMSAVYTLHKKNNFKIYILVHWPGSNKQIVREIGFVVKKMTNSFHNVSNYLIISDEDLQKQKNITTKIINTDISEIYYAHDVVGEVYQLLVETYPEAIRVMYGDGLGNVYEKKTHLSLIDSRLGKLATTNTKYYPNKLVLILPVFQSKSYLSKVELIICNRRVVQQVINIVTKSLTQLAKYENKLISKSKNSKIWVLLTEHFSEGRFLDKSKELKMWEYLIRKNVPCGDTVIIKPHPGETWQRTNILQLTLKDNYKIISINSKYIRYPIELWKRLIGSAEIITLSYPSLSLKYLYDVDTKFCLSPLFILKWFSYKLWRSYSNSWSMYEMPKRKLSKWAGNSILWQGSVWP